MSSTSAVQCFTHKINIFIIVGHDFLSSNFAQVIVRRRYLKFIGRCEEATAFHVAGLFIGMFLIDRGYVASTNLRSLVPIQLGKYGLLLIWLLG